MLAAIDSDYNNKSNEKQRFKSKKQIQYAVRIGSSLLHNLVIRGLGL